MNIDLKKYLKKGDKVAVAVSGGRDSMCLLHYLYNNCSDNKVFAINIEHGIRGQSSINDSKFVKDYCEKLNIKLFSYSVNAIEYQKNNKVTVEEAARILRYDCFKDLIDKKIVDYIAVAHHITDQCETIFMRLMRGTGIYGLTGITDKRDYIIRPFLNVSRDEIDEYVKINNIPYIKDETNDDNSYTRNFIRNEVFPLLDKKFTSYKQSLVRLQRTASEYIDLLESMSAEIIKECSETAKIKIDDLKGFKALSKYNILKTFKALGVFHDIEERHLELLLDFIYKQSGSMLDMPYGVKVYKEYDYLVFVRDNEIKEKSIKPFIKTDFDFNDIKIEIKKVTKDDFSKEKFVKDTIAVKNGKIDDNKFLFFDGEKIPDGAVIRYREDKDRFTPYNGKNKLLSDYMTDKKIPYRLRDKIAIVADGNEVLMILGYEISDKIKVIEDSKDIYKITTINTCC